MDEGKAFGRYHPNQELPLRGFEVRFQIPAREGPGAWRSGIPCVQNLLDHLSRYTQSETSRVKYLRHVAQFCRWSGFDAQQLVRLSKERAESLVQAMADELAAKDSSKRYVNTVIKRLRTFFRCNGYKDDRELEVRSYFVPTRYQKRQEYIPEKQEVYAMADAAGRPRNRAIILSLWSTGLRVSTLSALNYGDIAQELDTDCPVMVQAYPGMKDRVSGACKGEIPYYTFLCRQAVEAIKVYLRKREDQYSSTSPHWPLFHSDWNHWPRNRRSQKRLNRRTIGQIVKKSAKLAGLSQWKQVTPHCLRKAFESLLRSPTVDGGRLDKGTQEFFMGHVLPGSQDTYYDKAKVEFHREEYSKLDFSREEGEQETMDKVVDIGQLDRYLSEGWMFVTQVSDEKVVVRG